jgi:membrane-bound lytic murein transglycosylase A
MSEAAFSDASAASPAAARKFFESFFTPYAIVRPPEGALVTGYFEPELTGSLEPGERYKVPVYALPDDLVFLDGQTDRGDLSEELTAARRTPHGLAPYFTRQEIEQGALFDRGLEIAWLADPYDAYVMQVQGSGLVRLADGGQLRIGFSGKNGHSYTSVGKILIERGALSVESATLDKVLEWLRANPEQGREVMWENRSFPFFRVIGEDEAADGPIGSMGAPLTEGRSLAVDPRYHRLGLPVWVSAPELKDDAERPFQRLMIAQDSGSAIRGPVRGDIYWGSGGEAGRKAGATKHICDFTVLIPN